MSLYGEVRYSSSTLPAKFDGHTPCGSRDITYLICHVTLQDHVTKESFNFMEGDSSLYIIALLDLVLQTL